MLYQVRLCCSTQKSYIPLTLAILITRVAMRKLSVKGRLRTALEQLLLIMQIFLILKKYLKEEVNSTEPSSFS
jgi:hypothetical protein